MSISTSVSIEQLDKLLKDVVHWEEFALHLPGIRPGIIQEILIENPFNIAKQKQALYATWLEVHPSAVWNDVVSALRISEYIRVAERIQCLTQSSTDT